MPYGRKPSTKPRRAYKPKRKPAAKKPATFAKKVMAVVKGVAETKIKSGLQLDNSNLITGSGLNLAAGKGYANMHVMQLVGLSQGVGNDQRIGNKISNCKLRLSGFVETMPFNATTNTSQVPFELHMVILKAKNGLPASLNFTDVKTIPGSTTGGVVDVISSCYPWNTDAYTIKKHKIFKLAATFPYVSGSLTDVVTGSDPKFWFQRFNIDVPVDKTQTFTDGSITPAQTDYSIIWYVINGDGAALPASQVRCQVTYASYFTFQDL